MASHKLEFSDRWMFNRVMCDENVCVKMIRAVLGIEVGSIEYVNAEQSYEPGYESRGVRMDVVAKADGRVYDIEMQVAVEPELGRRMRYYQAILDTSELGKGQRYSCLPESYIVFLCLFDPYDFGSPVYRLDRCCQSEPSLDVGDGSHWLVLNASAWPEASDPELSDLLRYTATGWSDGALSCDIDRLVASYNQDQGWVRKVMWFEEELAYRCELEREQGIKQGIEQGASRYAALAKRLAEEDRTRDLIAAADDPALRDRLFAEFGL